MPRFARFRIDPPSLLSSVRLKRSLAGVGLIAAAALLQPAGANAGPGSLIPSPSQGDITCLALSVYHEARNQPLEGQRAVAYVVLNRLDAAPQPASICDIVYKGREFSWTLLDRRKQRPAEATAWQKAREVALDALASRDDDPVAGSTYFHSLAVRPAWAPQMVRMTTIGDHIFYASPKQLLGRYVHLAN
jgi:spore germination cell wall hydrolase CwlJ-like protein